MPKLADARDIFVDRLQSTSHTCFLSARAFSKNAVILLHVLVVQQRTVLFCLVYPKIHCKKPCLLFNLTQFIKFKSPKVLQSWSETNLCNFLRIVSDEQISFLYSIGSSLMLFLNFEGHFFLSLVNQFFSRSSTKRAVAWLQ